MGLWRLAELSVIVGLGQMFVITLGPGNVDLSIPATMTLAGVSPSARPAQRIMTRSPVSSSLETKAKRSCTVSPDVGTGTSSQRSA